MSLIDCDIKRFNFLSGRAVSRRSHHHILRRGGAGANPTGSQSAGGDVAGRSDDDSAQSRNPNTFEEKVRLKVFTYIETHWNHYWIKLLLTNLKYMFRSPSSVSRSTDESRRAAATMWFAPRRRRATASPTTWGRVLWKAKTARIVFKTKTVTARQRPALVVSHRCCVVTRFGSNRVFPTSWNKKNNLDMSKLVSLQWRDTLKMY